MTSDADWPVLDDGVVTLRVLRTDDAEQWKAGEDDEQRRWFEMPGPAPMQNVLRAIDNWRLGWRDEGPVRHWGIWLDDELAGGVEIRVRDDRRANVSYIVFPSSRRRGVAVRAIRLAVQWAFAHLGVTAIVAVVHPDNIASRSAATRAGFVDDGWAEDWEYGETGPMRRYVLGPTTGTTERQRQR